MMFSALIKCVLPLNNKAKTNFDPSGNNVLSLKLSPYNNDIILPDALMLEVDLILTPVLLIPSCLAIPFK